MDAKQLFAALVAGDVQPTVQKRDLPQAEPLLHVDETITTWRLGDVAVIETVRVGWHEREGGGTVRYLRVELPEGTIVDGRASTPAAEARYLAAVKRTVNAP